MMIATLLKSQPRLVVAQAKAAAETSATPAESTMPQMTKATVSTPASAKTVLLRL